MNFQIKVVSHRHHNLITSYTTQADNYGKQSSAKAN